MNEKAETLSAKMDAPSGLDLNPRPPRSVRVSKRAAGTLMAIAAVILGLFAYGGYKRQQRQVATLAEGSMPHNVAPATAAGAEIAKDVPSGNVPNSPQQGLVRADPGILQPPGDLQSPQANQLRGTISERRTGCSFGRHQFLPSLPLFRCRRLGSHLRKNADCLPLTSANSRPSSRRLRRERASDHQAPGSARK